MTIARSRSAAGMAAAVVALAAVVTPLSAGPAVTAVGATGSATQDAPQAGAQEISGRAMDMDGAPLPGVPVALHRVGDGSGSTVDASTADDEGRFRFSITAADSALYFVAMRYQDRLFIGPPARGGEGGITDYELRADPSSEAGAVATALSGQPGPLPGQAGGVAPLGTGGAGNGAAGAAPWLVALLAAVVAGIYLATAPGYRRRRQREALVELAGVENRLASGSDDPERDRRRRDTLRRLLAPHD